MTTQLVTALLMFVTVSAYAFQTSPPPSSASNLVGAWKLNSIETIRPDGSIVYPYYGTHPEGLIVYDANGWMSVQIVSDPAPTMPKAGAWPELLPLPRQRSRRNRWVLRLLWNLCRGCGCRYGDSPSPSITSTRRARRRRSTPFLTGRRSTHLDRENA